MSRTISDDLKAHFGQETTTVAVCWRIERADGTVLGFTSHDATITYDGQDYVPFTAADVSSLEQTAGGDPDNLDVSLAFDSDYITKADIAAGKYDDAEIYVFLINYDDTTQGIVQLVSGFLGETEIRDYGGRVQFHSLSDKLNNSLGSVYTYKCRASLGDSECGVALAGYTHTGSVTAVTSNQVFTDASQLQDDGYFDAGQVTFTSGENSGYTREIKRFTSNQFTLLEAFPYDIAVDDTYSAIAGCNKYPDTCQTKFDNFINYRGFPHLPGRDELINYPDAH